MPVLPAASQIWYAESPGAPVAPVAPMAPVAPVAPAGPVAPVAPFSPAGPAGPAGPVWFQLIICAFFVHFWPAARLMIRSDPLAFT